MIEWTLYYNPKCGTCRKTLALLHGKNIHPTLIEYLKTPPNEGELDQLLKKLGMEPQDLVRKKESIYETLGLAKKKLTRVEWLKIISENPILIERPIVVRGSKAVVARPPEKVTALL